MPIYMSSFLFQTTAGLAVKLKILFKIVYET